MIDSHAHILSEYYNVDEIVKFLKNNNVIKVLNCATNKKDIKEVIELSKKYENFLLPAVGFHPEEVEDFDINYLEEIIKNNKVYAIGEIGLDYYWKKDNKKVQKEVFETQIKLAEKYNIPVIVHSRESTQDCFDILKKYNVKAVIHCFTGSYEMAKEYIKKGYKLGIGGVLTFKNSRVYEVIEKIELKDILLETDSPYLSPEPNRGKQNNPANVYYVAKKIAEIKNTTIEKVIEETANNFIMYFDI